MANPEEEVLHQLTNDHAEGASDLFGAEDSFEGDGFEGEDGLEADGLEDGLEDSLEADGLDFESEDGFEGEDGFEDGFESEDALEAEAEALIPYLGAALNAESEDAFFGKLFSVIKKAAPIVGQIAKAAAPVLSAIPFPAAQVAGKLAGMVGNIAGEAEEAGEGEDGLLQRAGEAAAEAAVVDRRARPVVAAVAARQIAKHHAAALPAAHRQQIVRHVNRVAKVLTRTGGPRAIRALPKLAASVARTGDARGTSVPGRLAVLRRSAHRVARNPRLMRKLSAPTARGTRLARMMRIRPGMGGMTTGRGMGGYGSTGYGTGYGSTSYGTGSYGTGGYGMGRRRRRRFGGGYGGYGGWGGYGGGIRRINVDGPSVLTITPR